MKFACNLYCGKSSGAVISRGLGFADNQTQYRASTLVNVLFFSETDFEGRDPGGWWTARKNHRCRHQSNSEQIVGDSSPAQTSNWFRFARNKSAGPHESHFSHTCCGS